MLGLASDSESGSESGESESNSEEDSNDDEDDAEHDGVQNRTGDDNADGSNNTTPRASSTNPHIAAFEEPDDLARIRQRRLQQRRRGDEAARVELHRRFVIHELRVREDQLRREQEARLRERERQERLLREREARERLHRHRAERESRRQPVGLGLRLELRETARSRVLTAEEWHDLTVDTIGYCPGCPGCSQWVGWVGLR